MTLFESLFPVVALPSPVDPKGPWFGRRFYGNNMFTQSWLMLAGYVVMSIGATWLFYVAFKESWAQGLLVMLVPLYVIYYVVTRWEKSRDPVLVHLLGWVIFFVGM